MTIDNLIALNEGSFDIRDKNVNPEEIYQMGFNLALRLSKLVQNPLIGIGGDNRSDSFLLYEKLEQGIKDAGAGVLGFGCDIPRPVVYFAGERYNLDGVAYITASHINAKSNGLKYDSRKRNLHISEVKLQNPKQEILECYKNYLKRKDVFGVNLGKGQRIVADSLHGTSVGLAQEVFRNSGYKIIGLHDYIDRDFRYLEDNAPDPHLIGNMKELTDICRDLKCWGFALDGDMDRVGFVDENGKKVDEDETTMIFADYMINRAKEKGISPKVIYEIKSSNAVPEIIKKAGGIPIMERTGWQSIRKRMLEEKAILSGEISGHYSSMFYPVAGGDDGLFNALLMGKIISETGKSLSKLRKELPKYFITPELRIKYNQERNPEVVKSLESFFRNKEYQITKIGNDIRVEKYENSHLNDSISNWKSWVVIRTSKTEPEKLTMRFEGRTSEDLERISEEFISAIPDEDFELREKIKREYEVKKGEGIEEPEKRIEPLKGDLQNSVIPSDSPSVLESHCYEHDYDNDSIPFMSNSHTGELSRDPADYL